MRSALISLGLVSGAAINPITRVAQLLEGLSKQVEEEGKTEQKLYIKYKCWFTKTTEEKTASNDEANARIETLDAFIDDVKNGRIEFTTERQDLEKQLATINKQLETAKTIREQEAADFKAADEELNKGITALKGAIDSMKKGMGSNFLSKKFEVRRALLLASSSLTKAEFKQLQETLDNQPETKDWEKINKKGDFKEKYEARSGGIAKTLDKLLSDFEDNLDAATLKEDRAKESYKQLKSAKEDEKSATEQALTDMKLEGAARGMNLEDAEAEKSALTDQINADTKFMKEAKATFEKATEAYNARQSTRSEEVAAISQAIGILRSDDARDLFKKSFDSQTNFLQLDNSRTRAYQQVKTTLEKAGHSKRFALKLKQMTKVDDSIGKVIKSIDEMIDQLKQDKKDDLEKKIKCEKKFMKLMKDMKKFSLAVDDNQEIINTSEAAIAAAKDKIAEAEESIAQTKDKLKEATEIRAEENSEYKKAKADDEAAVKLIERASDALAGFYKNRSFVQVKVASTQNPVPQFLREGDNKYSGQGDEGGSVIAMLDMIKSDVKKDIKEAQEEEDAAQASFDDFKADSEDKIASLKAEISNQEEVIGSATQDKTDAEDNKDKKLAALSDAKKTYEKSAAHCDFYMLNFDLRNDQRTTEMDGLRKAKTILQGGQ